MPVTISRIKTLSPYSNLFPSIIPLNPQAAVRYSKSRSPPSLSMESLSPPFSYPQLKISFSSHGVLTLEKPKLNTSLEGPTKRSPDPETGGTDGDDGSFIGIGGGNGGDGGIDDDEYHIWDPDPEDGDGEDKGIFRRRRLLPEIFDKETANAVLSEWMKTMRDLPLGLRSAYEMGLISSAQFTRFLSFNAWPSFVRFLCRSLPENLSTIFNGKMVADPALPKKLSLEIFASTCFSILLEWKNRGEERFKREWDVVLINTVTSSFCNAFVVWSLAPSYSYGNSSRFQWRTALQKLPNNLFEKNYRFKKFDIQKRACSFFYKAISLFMIGSTARAVQFVLSTPLLNRGSTTSASFSTLVLDASASAIDGGIFLGLKSNVRNQVLFGIDRVLVDYFDVMGVALFFGSAARVVNAWIGANEASHMVHLEPSRDLGIFTIDVAAVKNVVTSGIGLLDPSKKVGSNADGRRKRIVRKKKVTSTIS